MKNTQWCSVLSKIVRLCLTPWKTIRFPHVSLICGILVLGIFSQMNDIYIYIILYHIRVIQNLTYDNIITITSHNTIWHTHYNISQCNKTLHNVIEHNAIAQNTIQYDTLQPHTTLQYSTMQYLWAYIIEPLTAYY